MTSRVLVIDEDPASHAALCAPLEARGFSVEAIHDNLVAIEKLKTAFPCAVVLDPMIRHHLNGYALLNCIELEHPEAMDGVFLYSAMPKETIARTASALAERSFRKPAETQELIAAVTAWGKRRCEVPPRRQKSVLIIEDDATTARVTRGILSELGYACEWAANGQSALARLFASRHDLVVLDLVMPDIDGFDLLQHLESHDPELLRRVVVLTGMPAKYLGALARHPIRGVLHKPIDIDGLRRLLGRCRGDDVAIAEGGGEVPISSC